jgi:iron complex outermembrane receptor protein
MMRSLRSRLSRGCWLTVPLIAGIPVAAHAQIEEIIVTATRRETSLQDTPVSVAAFTGEELSLGGIEAGRDLGIMVPNVVANPSGGGVGNPDFYIRGLPGVGIYIDGVWQGAFGFQEANFIEMERVEVLRGPQGTLFGRNTNGGAVNMTTRRPGDEFSARTNLEVGEFNRRNVSMSVDLPITDTLKTKWMAASLQNDGFLESVSVPRSFGDQDDTLFRADVLWEPTDNFSARITFNDEDKATTDPRIVRFTNPNHPNYIAYNVLTNNPDFIDQALAADPTFEVMDFGYGLSSPGFTALTHEPGYPGGTLGKWQSTSDTMEDGVRRDLQYATMTLNWDISENLRLESITSAWEMDRRQVVDFDGSEFTITTDDSRVNQQNTTEEIHLIGNNFDGRVSWLAGLYYLEQDSIARFYRWGLTEFTLPAPGPDDPPLNVAARDYVRSWGAAVGNASVAGYNPITFITSDTLSGNVDEDSAFFGEVVVGVTDKLDVTLGVRITADDGYAVSYTPTEAFRTIDKQVAPQGNVHAGMVNSVTDDPDLGNITTNKFAAQYEISDDSMVYFSWGEGFTSGGVTISPNFPDPIILDPEVITTREIGYRSDWADGRLRFNATYFESKWDGLRVPILPDDPDNPGQKLPFPVNTSEGLAEATGWEFEVVWAPTDRLRLTGGIGMIDAKYLDIGDPDPTGVNGIQPGSPFAYAPDNSASLSINYDVPLSNGGNLRLVGQYGWMDEYSRDPANQRTPIDANGNYILEPAYGILNARIVLEPPDRNWSLSVWGRNLTDEWYVNGGFDTRTVWGYDFSVIGRSREVGVGLGFTF